MSKIQLKGKSNPQTTATTKRLTKKGINLEKKRKNTLIEEKNGINIVNTKKGKNDWMKEHISQRNRKEIVYYYLCHMSTK